MTAPLLMLVAWTIEAAFGWPDWLYRHIRHPVVWLGALVRQLEKALNRPSFGRATRYAAGAVVSLAVVMITTILAYLFTHALPNSWPGFAIEVLAASSLIASRSLHAHVAAVAPPLSQNDITSARAAVSHIVGRDPRKLDDAGVARASLESLAENTSDGIVAPVFWGSIFGLPGIAAYKAVNTLDSMIGHRNGRYAAFGGFAARLDDAMNFIPARLTGAFFATGALSRRALTMMFRDARNHRSPNAGWPEAALAGALDVRLSGPRQYGADVTAEPWLNGDARDPSAADIRRGLALYRRAMGIFATILTMIVIIGMIT